MKAINSLAMAPERFQRWFQTWEFELFKTKRSDSLQAMLMEVLLNQDVAAIIAEYLREMLKQDLGRSILTKLNIAGTTKYLVGSSDGLKIEKISATDGDVLVCRDAETFNWFFFFIGFGFMTVDFSGATGFSRDPKKAAQVLFFGHDTYTISFVEDSTYMGSKKQSIVFGASKKKSVQIVTNSIVYFGGGLNINSLCEKLSSVKIGERSELQFSRGEESSSYEIGPIVSSDESRSLGFGCANDMNGRPVDSNTTLFDSSGNQIAKVVHVSNHGYLVYETLEEDFKCDGSDMECLKNSEIFVDNESCFEFKGVCAGPKLLKIVGASKGTHTALILLAAIDDKYEFLVNSSVQTNVHGKPKKIGIIVEVSADGKTAKAVSFESAQIYADNATLWSVYV